MILYILRHGDAGDPQPRDDDARQLSTKGRRRLEAAAPLWRRLGVEPDLILSSPLPRAAQTAELLASGTAADVPVTTDDRLRPGASWADLEAALANHASAERAALVGHDPDLSEAIQLLTGAGSVALRKGAMACLETDGAPAPRTATLRWLLDPDLYRDRGG